MKNKTSREVSFSVLLYYFQEEKPVKNRLDEAREHLSLQDRNLAQEIIYGVIRRKKTLIYFLNQIHSAKIKIKEKILLLMAIYQKVFLEKIPFYAIKSETMRIGKKILPVSSYSFLYALLNKIEKKVFSYPTTDSKENFSITYSYPTFFIEKLVQEYGKEKALKILDVGNLSPSTTLRIRTDQSYPFIQEKEKMPLRMGELLDSSFIKEVTKSSEFYIQNYTPVLLIGELKKKSYLHPKTILDLCCSPGGKLLAIHDFFPDAKLFANDISERKIKTLSENFKKYAFEAETSIGKAEEFPLEKTFDLILLDVPCSNSGVLNKRPEARWRIEEKNLQELILTQEKILSHALKLLAKDGQIWYITCSILQEENEKQVEKFFKQTLFSKKVLPNQEGFDGGFAAIVK